jgi:GDP-4-dehydro-6-deoxy-D-mannose reductase
MKQRILVTGSAGYIGGNIIRHLLKRPETEVYGFNRRPNPNLPDYQQVTGDLLEADLLGMLESIRPDLIFHAIGTNPKSPFSNQLLVNVEGTRRLLQALLDTGLKPKVVVVGSAAEYGLRNEAVDETATCLPEGEYGIAKLAQTQIAQVFARRYDLPIIIGRVFNVYGQTEKHLAVAAIAHQIARAEALFPEPSELHVHNLRSWRDFIHIDDVVEALLALAFDTSMNETSGQVYNIASGQSVPIGRILETLLTYTPLTKEDLKKVALQLHGIQREDISRADITKIRQHTDWSPRIPLETGLGQELALWRNRLGKSAVLV